MQKSLAKNSIYNILYTIANILFPFITSIYVSRILLPTGVGRVAAAQNIASYFTTIAALGLPSYGVREFAKVRENKIERNRLFTELLLINFVSTTLAIVGFFGVVFFNAGFNGEWLLYAACGVTVFFNYLNIDWMYQGLEEYGYITGRSLLIKFLSLVALLLLVRTRQDYVIYALISSFAIGGNYIFNVVHARKFIRIDFHDIRVRRHIKPLILIAGIIFLGSIYSKIDITMLNVMATDDSVGYYSYAQKTVNMVIVMANAVTAALLPRLSYYYDNDRGDFYRLLDKGFQILCLTTLPLTVGLFLVASQAVVFLYGEAFTPASITIQLMCPLVLIKSFGDLFCYQLAYSTKNERIMLPSSALASVINIIVNAALIPTLLQNGAVIASVLSELTTNAVQFIYIKRKIHFSINIRSLMMGLISTGIMAISILLIMRLNLSNTVGLILEVTCGGIIYVLINLLMKNELMFEILNKVKRKLTR
jgi:O-antigen/teichoic acid export membrane protein